MSAHLRRLERALDAAAPGLHVVGSWGRALAAGMPHGVRLLVAGNGGSAAQAQHLTAELVGRYRDDRPPFAALALHAETSSLTAIANDYGVAEMFARQVRAHGRHGDALLLLSTSGRSANILAAAHTGQELGLRVWALCGRFPNPLADLAHEAVCIDSADCATVQELHLIAIHELCEQFDAALRTPVELPA